MSACRLYRSTCANLGPFVLGEHLYNTRTGAVFRVTDKNSNVYAVKVFTYGDNQPVGHKERRLYDYANERSSLLTVTKASCPDLLKALVDKDQAGKSVTCSNHHVQLMLGLDVPLVESAGGAPIASRRMRIVNSQGDDTERHLDFGANTLLPYMAGGRLNDLVTRVPKYQSMVVRYPLYVDVAPQMVDAVRYLHSLHLAHLGITASTILCSSVNCEDAVLADPSTAWNGEAGSQSPFNNELMQQSVRFAQFTPTEPKTGDESPKPSEVAKTFSTYLKEELSWEGTMKVDWYGLGGALFYVLAGIRPVAEDRSGPNSHDVAEFIYKALQSQRLLSKVPTEDARAALAKIRDQVAEGLLLVDGLLQTDRSKRISFDAGVNGKQQASLVKTKLRTSKSAMSALQVDTARPGNSCASFLQDSTKESATLASLPVGDKTALPAFIQDICL